MKKGQIFFAALAVVLFLSGCGRHHKDKVPETGGTTTGTTTSGTTEKEFTTFVKELLAKPENEEPMDIEATTFTGVETDDEAAFDSLLQ